MIRCIIVDDEPIARQILEQYVTATPGVTLLASCRNALEAFAKLEQHEVNLIFLDIEMPLVTGIDFLRTLTKPPRVILTTAYPQYAVEAFALNAVDYLLKPFSLQRFQQAVAKVNFETTAPEEAAYLIIKEKGALIRIPQADIIYCAASRDYVKIVTVNKTFLAGMTMKTLEETLPSAKFVRIHKSYIAGISHIQLVKATTVIMSNKQTLPLSPNYKKQLLDVFAK